MNLLKRKHFLIFLTTPPYNNIVLASWEISSLYFFPLQKALIHRAFKPLFVWRENVHCQFLPPTCLKGMLSDLQDRCFREEVDMWLSYLSLTGSWCKYNCWWDTYSLILSHKPALSFLFDYAVTVFSKETDVWLTISNLPAYSVSSTAKCLIRCHTVLKKREGSTFRCSA